MNSVQFMRWVNERERTICYRKKQIEVSFSFVCLVIDNEFRYNIVKEALDPRGYSRVDLQTTLTML